MSDLLEDLPYLRPYHSRPFFGGGVPSKYPRAAPIVRRKKETWLYTIILEQNRTARTGQLKLYRFDRTSPIATAPFSDLDEGDKMFEDVWERVQEETAEENEKLR